MATSSASGLHRALGSTVFLLLVLVTACLVLVTACGEGSPVSSNDPLLAPPGTATEACRTAFLDSHNAESAGTQPNPFLASIQACQSLVEWTAAARASGVTLKGREAEFVANTCDAAGTEVQARAICQQAKAAMSGTHTMP